jgi:hypothetical protein
MERARCFVPCRPNRRFFQKTGFPPRPGLRGTEKDIAFALIGQDRHLDVLRSVKREKTLTSGRILDTHTQTSKGGSHDVLS